MLRKWLAKRALLEKHPLPTGRKEFEEWSDRIIAGAGLIAKADSQKYVLANILCNNCGPTVAFESDHYFISMLRKHAVNQVADTIRKELYEQKKAAATAPEQGNVLEPAKV
jgi:hypothetical protein